jgi:pimeloyl-ACP methyl ester carboxylesterase
MIRLLLLCICSLATVKAQVANFDVRGNWIGDLKVGATIELIFKVTGINNLSCSLDVPLQGAKDIPATVEERVQSVKFHVKAINGYFDGKKIDSITLEGNWKQNGGIYPLKLVKKEGTIDPPKRPQTPKGPFPYISEDIIVKSLAGNLAGTLTKPKGKGPFPAIVLITGSGSQDRDETIFNHKPFFVLSDALTRAGFAVLRMDDRGVGLSEGDPSKATTKDLSDDIYAGIRALHAYSEIDSSRIGLIGHSEGGMIAQILAATYPQDIAFICSMAGLGISGLDVLVWQTRKVASKTMSMGEVEKSVFRQKTLLTMIKESTDSVKLRAQLTDSLGLWAVEKQKMFVVNTPEFRAQLNQLQSPWLKYFISYDPEKFLRNVKCPVFAINGSEDMQVESENNLQSIESLLKKYKNTKVRIKEYKGMNHLFQRCTACDIEEYAKIETTIDQEVIDDIINWLNEVTRNASQRKR